MSRCPENHFILSRYCQAFRVVTITLLVNLTFNAVLWGQTSPIYSWSNKADLPTVSGSSLNIEDLTLAVALDSDQNIYTLSLENGVDKRDPDGNLLQENLILGDLLDSPRDIAIDEAGFIYVADYISDGGGFTDDGKIRVFDASGNYLPEKTIFTSFYRPLGLDVSGDKIYVAEYYDGLQGPEQGSTFSRVRIYDKNSKALLRESKNVDIPLRIAVNSEGKIYVSQAGSGNTGVLIFDDNLAALGRLPNITSPGSVIVDALDFVHVIEYGSRVKFSEFINFDNLGLVEISSLAKDISDGVKNEEFLVKIFDPNGSFNGTILEQLDFPVDLAQKDCGLFYVNNSEIFDGSFWGMYVPSKLEFDLEIYERIPSIDAAEAPLLTCPGPIEINLQPGENSAMVNFEAPTATDVCGAEVSQTAGLASGSDFLVGQHTIEFTAEDAAGNATVCSFTITVNQTEDLEPPQIQCPEDVSLAINATECTAIVDYEMPKATDDSGQVEITLISGPAIGNAIGIGDYVVKYQATDAAGNTATCEFALAVGDTNAAAIANCPGDQQEVLTSEGFLLPDYTQDLVVEDCSQVTVEQVPSAGTILSESTQISIIAEDEFGNRSTECVFEVILTPEAVGITSCANSQVLELSADCTAVLPDLTSEISTSIEAEVIQEPAPGTIISEETTLRFTATDANGGTDFCEITVSVADNLNPEVTCPADKQFSFDPAEGFVVPDFRGEAEATDNCSFELIQEPAPGTTIYSDRFILITAIDAAGNETFCEFALDLIEQIPDPVEITSCVNSQVLELSAACTAVLPNLTSEISTSIEAEVIQEPAPGTVISEETTMRFTATDANGGTDFCEITVSVADNLNPEVTCPADKQFSFDPAEGFVVPDFRGEAEATDNCSFELIQDPAPGTTIYSDRVIFITAIDAAGNETFCEFALDLTEQIPDPVEITSCANSQVLALGASCTAFLPDLTSEISTSIEAEVIQEPAPGKIISEETTLRFTATDANGNTDFCEITVGVTDNLNPEITCPADKQFSFDPAEGFVVTDFRSEAEATDNCAFELTQDPAPGTTIYSDRVILITAIDAAGNETFCEFVLDLTEETPDPVEITSCPSSQALELSSDCTAVLPDLTAEISTSIEAEVVQEPAPGTVISEETTLRFTATDANGGTDFCEITVSVADNLNPEVTCPADKQFSFDPEKGFVVPDFRSEAEATDNCAFELTQDPAPGTTIYSDRVIFITAIDAAGNETFCEFALDLTEQTPDPVEITSCANSQVLELSAACTAVLPDLTAEISTSIEAEVVQEPAPGTIISEETTLRFTATDANGGTDFCEITVSVADNLNPEVTCPADKRFPFDPAEGFVVPDFRNEVEATDNCTFELTQNPAPGTTIYSDRVIFITAKDVAGNETFCEFALDLTEQTPDPVEITSCAATQMLELNANCTAVLPDLTSEISTSIEAEVIQEPAPGKIISEETTLRFTATDANRNTDVCETTVNVEDNLAPQITCPGDMEMTWNAEEGYVLPDLTRNISVNDNCAVSLLQEPAPGTLIKEEQSITILATDASGNRAECSFWLYLIEKEILSLSCPAEQVREIGENCGYEMEDFISAAKVNMENAVITQEPAPGTLIYENMEVTLSASAEGQAASCSFALNLKDSQPPGAKCAGTFTLTLNEQGTATLGPEQVDNGSTDNCGIVSSTLSKTSFSASDVGVNVVEFTVFDAAGNKSSCETEVIVEAPANAEILCVEEVTLQLNANRRAVIDPRALFTGGTGTVQYSVSKEEFTCADLGTQVIRFSYTTPYDQGNCEIRVTVEDPDRNCEQIIDEPEDPGHFVIISPNPGNGLMEIYSSADIAIEQARVFDMRGRFLLTRDFSDGSPQERPYLIDLRKYQSGVYTIELETNSGKFIRRAIIKND